MVISQGTAEALTNSDLNYVRLYKTNKTVTVT